VKPGLRRIVELHRELASAYEALVDDEGFFDQHDSPLGSRLHLRLARSGELVGSQLGRRVVVAKADVYAYIERHRIAPTEPAVGTLDEDEELLAAIGGKKTEAA
jgi:hypothetical protein